MKTQSPKKFSASIRREIAQLRKAIRPFYMDAGRITRDEREKDFKAGRGPDGKNWKSLASETIKAKKRKHTSSKIKRKGGISGLANYKSKPSPTPSSPLMDQGVLKGLDVKIENKRVVMRPWKSRREVVTSTGDSIAGIHEKRYKGRPARHHWGISVAAEKRILKAWNALLKDFIKGIT